MTHYEGYIKFRMYTVLLYCTMYCTMYIPGVHAKTWMQECYNYIIRGLGNKSGSAL
jgi:hypothetical protein